MKIGIWKEKFHDFNFTRLNNYYNIQLFNKSELFDLEYEIPEFNIILSTNYSKEDFQFEDKILEKENKITVHVYIAFNNIVIGPARRLKSDICCDCLYHRLRNNRNNEIIETNKTEYDLELDIFSQEILTIVIGYIVDKCNNNDFFKGEMMYLSLSDMKISKHNIIRYEECHCNKEEVFNEKLIDYEEEEVCRNKDLRVKEYIEVEKIKKDIYDPISGVIANIYKDMNSRFLPMICVEFNSSNGKIVNGAYGRSKTYKDSEKSAILEMLERYSNMWPKRRIKRVRATYNQIKDKAVNPVEFILNDESITGISNKIYKKYSEDLDIDWIYGYSIKKKSNVLIPEQIAYFDIDEVRRDVNRFIFETSNGAALGGSIKEATLYGLFEVIERDAFLITWYNKLSLVKIEIDSIDDDDIRKIIGYITNVNYDIYLFDSTMENRIPSVICLAINRDKNSVVSSYLAAGAHINPIKAIESALVEVISSIPVYEKSFINRKKEAENLYNNPDTVLRMEDHVLLYSFKETIKNYDFLFRSQKIKKLQELYPEWEKFKNERSITKVLKYVISQVTKYNKDVIIVDCSNDLIEDYGLYAVKVLVPGMLSMTFGQQNKRINVERVKKIPVICKYRETEVEEFNLYPHPFP